MRFEKYKGIKQYYENCVLGAILMNDCLIEVHQFLKPLNFGVYTVDSNGLTQSISNKLIFEAMVSLYPIEPINIISVHKQLLKGGLNYSYALSSLTDCVNNHVMIREHALKVLQLDLQMKFENFIISMLQKVHLFSKHQIIQMQEIIQDPIFEDDIFSGIAAFPDFLKSYHYHQEVITAFKSFTTNVASGIDGIRRENKIGILFYHLEKLSINMDDESKLAMKKLASITKEIFDSGSVPEKYKQLLIDKK